MIIGQGSIPKLSQIPIYAVSNKYDGYASL